MILTVDLRVIVKISGFGVLLVPKLQDDAA